MQIKKNTYQVATIIIFTLIGVSTRTIYHIGPNIEFITGLSIAAGYFFKDKKLSFLVPVLTMFFSDLIIGNTNIFWFTWSGFLAGPVIGALISKFRRKKSNFIPTIIYSEFGGIVSTLIFYLWTNFGVVVFTTMYPDTIEGLAQSYINALPFLLNQLIGNVFIVPVVFGSVLLVQKLCVPLSFKKLSSIL